MDRATIAQVRAPRDRSAPAHRPAAARCAGLRASVPISFPILPLISARISIQRGAALDDSGLRLRFGPGFELRQFGATRARCAAAASYSTLRTASSSARRSRVISDSDNGGSTLRAIARSAPCGRAHTWRGGPRRWNSRGPATARRRLSGYMSAHQSPFGIEIESPPNLRSEPQSCPNFLALHGLFLTLRVVLKALVGRKAHDLIRKPVPTFRGHALLRASEGFWTRIVSSRSGLVERSATGHPTSSSTRRTYLMACAGRSAQDRALAVGALPALDGLVDRLDPRLRALAGRQMVDLVGRRGDSRCRP